MSIQSLYTAATGMEAMQSKLDVIANNLANINTTAFKRDRANFEDLFYRHERYPGAQDAAGNLTAVGTSIGLGTRMESVQTEYRQGSFQDTGNPLDIAIEGQGFIQLSDPSGNPVYTRAGNFSINANYQLVVGSADTGRLVDPPITFPPDTTGVVISPSGIVSVAQVNSATYNQAGQLQLAMFANPQGLLKLGENLYTPTPASGTPILGNPGQQGAGQLRQGFLEASNVEPVQELIDLITTQRSFELNSQSIQVGDQVLQLIANLRR